MDVRREEEIEAAVAKTANTFGGIDILVNNASALFLAKTPETPMKRFDLMFSVNVRGTFATTQAAHRYLAKAENPHVLVLSPPLNLVPSWFADHCAGNFFIDDAVLAAEGLVFSYNLIEVKFQQRREDLRVTS